MKGRVKFFNGQRGFGFIRLDDGTSVFVHVTSIEDAIKSLNEGDEVEFETEETPRGLKAKNVKRTPKSD